MIKKREPKTCEHWRPKSKCLWFLGFYFQSYTEKPKFANRGSSKKNTKTLKYENVASKSVDMLFK